MRDLNQDAGAISGLWIAAAGAAVGQIHEHLDALLDNVVAFLAANVGHEPNAAGVVLVRRVVETLRGRQTVDRLRDFQSGLLKGTPQRCAESGNAQNQIARDDISFLQ